MESRSAVLTRIASPEVTLRLDAARGLAWGAWRRHLPPLAAAKGITLLTWKALRWAAVGR